MKSDRKTLGMGIAVLALVLLAGGVAGTGCLEVEQCGAPCEKNSAGGGGAGATGGTGGTGGCVSPTDCPDDFCSDPTCEAGKCGAKPVNEGADCGGAGPDGAPLHCIVGVCSSACVDDTECLPQTECVTYTCDKMTQVCVATPGATPKLANVQVAGDCKNAVCTGATLTTEANPADKPMPMGALNPCEIWDCDGAVPVQGAPQPLGTECGASTCTLAANGKSYEQTIHACDASATCQPQAPESCGLYACDEMGAKCKTSCAKDKDCASFNFCNNGQCEALHLQGDGCMMNNACQSGNCIDGVCCVTTCPGVCKSCAVAGYLGICANIPAGTDPGNECADPKTCNGMGACTTANGKACAIDSDCQSGNCVLGLCCNNNCNGLCHSCNVAGALGTCTMVPSGQDPDGECSSNWVCDGMGACKLPLGSACGANAVCLSGFCVDKTGAGVTGVCCESACGDACFACRQAKTGVSDGLCSKVTNGTPCGVGLTCTDGNCQ